MSFFLTFDEPLPEHKKNFDRDDIGSSIAAIRQEGVVQAQSKGEGESCIFVCKTREI
jgi:hypothetical protein